MNVWHEIHLFFSIDDGQSFYVKLINQSAACRALSNTAALNPWLQSDFLWLDS